MKRLAFLMVLAALLAGCASGGCRDGSDAEFPEIERWWK